MSTVKLDNAIKRAESTVNVQVKAKKKNVIWKWVVGGVAALMGFFVILWASRQFNVRTKELAKLRTNVEQDKVFAKDQRVAADMQRSQVTRDRLKNEAQKLKEKALFEEKKIKDAEAVLRHYEDRLLKVKDWKTLDKMNEEGR